MKVERFLLHEFSKDPRESYEVLVPDGSIFLNKVKALPDGIYVFYAVPELFSETNQSIEKFVIIQPKKSVPAGAIFVDIVDIVTDMSQEHGPGAQGVLLFPIFKL